MARKRGEINGRRGLSPLIATVLLIAFAVALATMVISWLSGTESPPPNPCHEMNIALQQLTDGEAICYNAQTRKLQFLVKNVGSVTIDRVLLRVVDEQQETTDSILQADLTPGGITKYEFAYPTLSPHNIVASIMPGAMGTEDVRWCPEHEIQRVNVPLC